MLLFMTTVLIHNASIPLTLCRAPKFEKAQTYCWCTDST